MLDLANYLGTYVLSALDPRVLLHMIGALPTSAWVIGTLLLIRFRGHNPLVWLSWVMFPGFWKQPDFKAANGYPLVSVVIPSRNQGPRVAAAVRSVLASGWPNLEVIVGDDFSTDSSWQFPKEFERSGRVRVMCNPRHGGKTTVLNLAMASARGEYILVMDAQNQMEPGTISKLMGVITSDHKIGAVTCCFRVISGDVSLVTAWQEWDYPQVILDRMLRSKLGLMNIITGGGGLFRKEALEGIGYYDPGLGDDTDVTMRLRKQGWRLRFCHEAVISTDPPHTLSHLIRQRTRWQRNMVKIRIHKHWDLILPWRYGWLNTILMTDTYMVRVVLPFLSLTAIFWIWATAPFTGAMIIGQGYVFSVILSYLKGLLVKDLSGMPRWHVFIYIPIYFVVALPVRYCVLWSFVMEVLRIGARHPYTPKHLWDESPRW